MFRPRELGGSRKSLLYRGSVHFWGLHPIRRLGMRPHASAGSHWAYDPKIDLPSFFPVMCVGRSAIRDYRAGAVGANPICPRCRLGIVATNFLQSRSADGSGEVRFLDYGDTSCSYDIKAHANGIEADSVPISSSTVRWESNHDSSFQFCSAGSRRGHQGRRFGQASQALRESRRRRFGVGRWRMVLAKSRRCGAITTSSVCHRGSPSG